VIQKRCICNFYSNENNISLLFLFERKKKEIKLYI
jgi:hypothetical protein